MRSAVKVDELFAEKPAFSVRGGSVPQIRVVAVDSDDFYRDMLSNELSEQGFAVTTYSDARSVLLDFESLSTADLMVLDWGATCNSGLELLRQLRRLGVNLPIVFLTRRLLASNENLALEHGAIDFIDKSRGVSILAHRLRIGARMKAPSLQRDKAFQLGKLTLKPHVSRAYWGGNELNLTVGEFKIVSVLAGNIGHHVTYREIYDALHYHGFIAGGGENGYRTNVRSAIKRIRRKFQALDPAFDRIQNFTAFGYIWAQD
ncbi:MAG: response regulator transcription factor [Alphaproteobacteria bacterium]|nr:response regulator transcription factor [Alphaproteobacteria bacterium]